MSSEAILVSSVSNIIHLTGFSNFSKEERDGYVILTSKKQFILTSPLYSEAVKKETKGFEVLEFSSSGKFLKDILEELVSKHKITTLLIEEDDLRVNEYKLFKKFFKLKPAKLHDHRSIKSDEQILKIKKACLIGDQAFKNVLKKIKIGITEKEIAYELEYFFKKSGAEKSFETIVAFGKNSSAPHHQTGETKLKNNQFILMDFGVKYKNYCSDMTRTIFFGRPDKKQLKMYETVLISQQKAVEYIKNVIASHKVAKQSQNKEIATSLIPLAPRNDNMGVKAFGIHKEAEKYIVSQGFPPIPHSLGHGIGLEVHEHPRISARSKDFLKSGMVFSLEPGIYIPGFGGVRIEDLFVIKKNKLVQITGSSKFILLPLLQQK